MPKSRKRKGAKPYRQKNHTQNSTVDTKAAPRAGMGFFAQLYAEEALIFRQAIAYFPLIAGSILGGGLAVRNGYEFALVLGMVFYVHYVDLLRRDMGGFIHSKRTALLIHFVAGILVIGFFAVTRSIVGSLFLLSYSLLGICRNLLTPDTPRLLFLRLAALSVQMMLLAVLGAYAQTKFLFFPMALIGFIPASYLMSAEFAFSASMLESYGWKRATVKEGEKTTVVRPASLTRVFTLLLVVGPLVPILLSPLNILPPAFLLCVLPIYFLPSLATAFLEELQADRIVGLRCVHLACFAAVLALVGGGLAQF